MSLADQVQQALPSSMGGRGKEAEADLVDHESSLLTSPSLGSSALVEQQPTLRFLCSCAQVH